MNMSELLRFLGEQTSPSRNAGHRHILTFRNPAHYQEFLHDLKLGRPEWGESLPVYSTALIQGIVCKLESEDLPLRFRRALSVEEDTAVQLHGLPTQERHVNPGIPWGVRRVRAPEIWSTSTGHQVRIGVVDTGVDFHHPDLKYSLARGVNLLSRMAWPIDDNGHGTHIAGTIAGAGAPDGLTGVAPRSVIYPVKAFDHNGAAYVSDIIRGIDWCIYNRIQIINMSFGMKKKSTAMEDVVIRATEAGVVIVASAGNDKKKKSIDYPARLPQTIAVGASNRERRIAPFSNNGSFVDIYAPGDQIRSAWLGGKYKRMNGTSMATSHVSGAIALLLAQSPGLIPAEIKTMLQETSRPLVLADKAKSAPGEIDAFKLVKKHTNQTVTSVKRKPKAPSKRSE